MSEPNITVTDAPDDADIKVIQEGLKAYNTEKTGYDDYKPLAVFVTDTATGKVVGGLYGGSYIGQARVERFFLPEDWRRGRIGSRVLKMAEEEAKRRGCSRITLNTLEIQAPGVLPEAGLHDGR